MHDVLEFHKDDVGLSDALETLFSKDKFTYVTFSELDADKYFYFNAQDRGKVKVNTVLLTQDANMLLIKVYDYNLGSVLSSYLVNSHIHLKHVMRNVALLFALDIEKYASKRLGEKDIFTDYRNFKDINDVKLCLATGTVPYIRAYYLSNGIDKDTIRSAYIKQLETIEALRSKYSNSEEFEGDAVLYLSGSRMPVLRLLEKRGYIIPSDLRGTRLTRMKSEFIKYGYEELYNDMKAYRIASVLRTTYTRAVDLNKGCVVDTSYVFSKVTPVLSRLDHEYYPKLSVRLLRDFDVIRDLGLSTKSDLSKFYYVSLVSKQLMVKIRAKTIDNIQYELNKDYLKAIQGNNGQHTDFDLVRDRNSYIDHLTTVPRMCNHPNTDINEHLSNYLDALHSSTAKFLLEVNSGYDLNTVIFPSTLGSEHVLTFRVSSKINPYYFLKTASKHFGKLVNGIPLFDTMTIGKSPNESRTTWVLDEGTQDFNVDFSGVLGIPFNLASTFSENKELSEDIKLYKCIEGIQCLAKEYHLNKDYHLDVPKKMFKS